MAVSTELLRPGAPEEAVEIFGNGEGVRVLAGGTLLVPELHLGSSSPERVLMLQDAGLDFVEESEGVLRVGAMTAVDTLCSMPPPLGRCAAGIGDTEIRSAATLGGNLCSPAGFGDLQAPLLALNASAISVGSGGKRNEPLEDFLAAREGRLLLEVCFAAPLEMNESNPTDDHRTPNRGPSHETSEEARPAAGAFASLGRPHAHHFTVMSVAGIRTLGGEVRLAAVGLGPVGIRLRAAEAVASNPEAAGEAAASDVEPADDPLASGWYRRRSLPALVKRVLSELEVQT